MDSARARILAPLMRQGVPVAVRLLAHARAGRCPDGCGRGGDPQRHRVRPCGCATPPHGGNRRGLVWGAINQIFAAILGPGTP